jgi:dynein intermediate chain 2, axonemal
MPTAACREKNLEKTLKEARLKAKKEANRKDDRLELTCDEDLSRLEEEFYSTTGTERGISGTTGGG